ncbi:DUF397 domain-containing protein [Streptomyces uncialis]|uniref:DUF397 domain-containing protein n=1 Tax=Streptomyces uncialis TaxID=1048205 RepID=UPI0022590B37|nr:DUF397 domain-containing protein [Streptomyces uncialis]MCX4660695.1 DUF397 domain-containing protein [Streptomyces uncialis]
MRPNGLAGWAKSSYSDGEGGNCLEWLPSHGRTHGTVPVRDSKTAERVGLLFQASAWRSFIAGIKEEQ